MPQAMVIHGEQNTNNEAFYKKLIGFFICPINAKTLFTIVTWAHFPLKIHIIQAQRA